MQGVLCGPEFLAQLTERRSVSVVAVDVLEHLAEPGEGVGIETAILLDAVQSPLLELVERPSRFRDADDWHIQLATFG